MEREQEASAEPCKIWLEPAVLLYFWLGREEVIDLVNQKMQQVKENPGKASIVDFLLLPAQNGLSQMPHTAITRQANNTGGIAFAAFIG